MSEEKNIKAKRFKSPKGIEITVLLDYDNDLVKWDNEGYEVDQMISSFT